MNETTPIRVRFPPSPTGLCHVGTARMAVVNYLFARANNGAIVFRSEDTDIERSKVEYENDILESLTWLGLSWDEFYRQSERTDIYRVALEKLIASGKAYISEEESLKEKGTLVSVVRLKNPGVSITFCDIIRGDITFDTTELGDFVIARSIQDPVYHFAVVVDDALMRISHVIRGEEHISNTPRQILIQEALGFARPQYAHYPLHLGTDKSKLSKRKGDVSVRSYRDKGYLPQALLNYIPILGWTPPSAREILSLDEMIGEFTLDNLHKSGAVFDIDKLNWYNREYLLQMSENDFASGAMPILESSIHARSLTWSEIMGNKIMPLIRERISVWEDIRTLTEEGEFDFFFSDPIIDTQLLPGKGSTAPEALQHLTQVKEFIQTLSLEQFTSSENIKNALWDYATEFGRGRVLWPLRYALTGRERSPDPFIVASIVGKESVQRRIDSACELLRTF